MKVLLEKIYQHQTLSKTEAETVLVNLTKEQYNDCQIASFLTAFQMRKITLEELKGFRRALLNLCLKVNLSEFNPMDLCGTGGDGKNTFNISTLSAFVVAGSGIPVAKHGNYGVSSISGSSNVLEAMGIKFTNDNNLLKKQLEKANICLLHAPLFHPAMKTVAPIRSALGVRTFFNMLGPLVNPCQPKIQMSGVFNLEVARLYHYLLQSENSQYSVVYAYDGFDEISLTNDARVITPKGEINANGDYFGMPKTKYEDLYGGETILESAEIFQKILTGNGTTAQNNVVLANASIAINTYFPDLTIDQAKSKAEDSLFNQKGLASFNQLKSTF